VNTLATALIVYKIITVYHDIRGLGFNTSNVQASAHGNGRRDLYPLISILIESGMMTFVGQLTQSIMYKSAPVAFSLVGGSVVMLYVRASYQLLIWCHDFIYLLHREFRQLLSLCVSRWAFPTIIIHQGQCIQRIRDALYSLQRYHRSSIRLLRGRMILKTRVQRGSSYPPIDTFKDPFCPDVHISCTTKLNTRCNCQC
jgi:hypothetical protein